MFSIKKLLDFRIKYILICWLLSCFFSTQVHADHANATEYVDIAIVSDKTLVNEGDTATVTVKFTPHYTAYAGCSIKLLLVDGGSATSGLDFDISGDKDLVFFSDPEIENPKGMDEPKKIVGLGEVLVSYNIAENDGIEPNETISPTLSISGKCKFHLSSQWPTITIIGNLNPLTTSLTALTTEVAEGAGVTDIARLGVALPSSIDADANCNATAVVKVIGGTATSGVDFNFTPPIFNFGQGDGNAKTQLLALDVLQGQTGDGDKTIEFEATFTSSGTSNGNSCPLTNPDPKKITITIKDTPTSNLTGTLENLKTTVQEGEGVTQIADLKFSLPTNSIADTNCNAVAEIKVTGGTALANVDFSFTPTNLTFGQGDGNSKNQAVNLTLLSGGTAGDGNKTIEFEATFASTGGSIGNSCPLVSAISQKTVITIVDTKIVSNSLTTSLTALITEIFEGVGVTNIARFGVALPSSINADANCNATAVIRVIGGTATSGVDFNFTPPIFNFRQGDGNAKTQLLALDVLQGQAGDGDKTIEFEATFTSSGTSNGNSCPLANPDPKKITITIIDTPTSNLTGTLENLKTTVQEGEGVTQIADLKFSLPTNSIADTNCNAIAEIKVTGGTALPNVDFSFTPTNLTFGQGDGNSKNQAVNLTLLSGGTAGDGNKTIEFEATFASTGGSIDNSCPLVSATSQKTVLTIVDTEVVTNLLTTSLTALVTEISEGAGVTNIARFGVALPSSINADANCNATAVVRVIGGNATSGVDFNFTPPIFNFRQGDGNAKTQLLALDILQGQSGDGDKTIELEATFASSGTNNGNSCPLAFADAKRMTLTIKETPATSNLTGILENLKTTVQEGAGVVQLANIKLGLSANGQADANCKAVAEVNVVGGSARFGIDFRFSPVKLTFGQGDVGLKTQVVNLNLLAGEVGDGDKTIELEIMFDSLGGATGNSCPLENPTRLAKATIQKTVITIKDTPASSRPRVEVKLNDITIGVDKTSASFPISIVQTPLNSNINCNPQVELVPSNLRGLINISPTRFNKTGGNATVNIIKREPTNQVITVEAKLRVDERVCDSAGNVSAKITVNADTTKPSISISASATSATEKNTVNVSYKLTGKLTSCKTINPLVVSAETTASQDQYVLDTNTNLLDTPIVAVKILKQDPNRESVLVLAAKAEGCQLDVNNTVSIRIRKKQTITIKQEPEALNNAICLTLQKKTGISGSGATIETEIINKLSGNDRSYYISNCKQGANIRNVEPEEIASQTNAVLSAVNQQLKNVRSRLDTLRSTKGQRGLDISDATLNIQGEVISVGLLGGAAGDSDNGVLRNSRWGVFANGEYGFGSKDRGVDTAVAAGDRNFDFNSTGLTIGADYRLPNEKTIVGAALGYKNTELNFTTQLGGTSTKGYNLSLYGTYLLSEKSYLDIVLGYGADRLTSSRPVNNDGSGNIGNKTTFAIGKPKATELTFSVGGGYEFNQGEWSLSPYGRLDFTKGNINAYTESASHSSANTSMFLIDKQTIESLTSTLGIKASKIISTSSGVFIPNVSLEWKHEFKQQGAISGQSLFIKDNPDLKLPSGFNEAHGHRTDKDYYTVGVGVSAVFPKGRSAYLNFESRLGDTSIEDNAVKAGFRWEF